GVKCGARGDSGLTARSFGSAAQSSPASAKTPASPRAPIPPPMRQRTSRRERGGVARSMSAPGWGRKSWLPGPSGEQEWLRHESIHIQKFIRAEQHLGILLPARQLPGLAPDSVGPGRQELQAHLQLLRAGGASIENHESAADTLSLVGSIGKAGDEGPGV